MNKTGGRGPDERLWNSEVDKAGNGYAVIRFLPALQRRNCPGHKSISRIQRSWRLVHRELLTTLEQKDPVGDLNRVLWNSGLDSDKDVARKQKRKLSYYSNIYVVKDPLHPENEGKVFSQVWQEDS